MQVRFNGQAFRLASYLVAGGLLAACSAGGNLATPGNSAPGQLNAQHVALSGNRTVSRAVHVVKPAVGGAFVAGAAKLAAGTIYDSIPTNKAGKFSSYISSEGFECCTTKEFGDGLVFTQTNARLKTVSVIMSSWGCESGNWYSDNCETNNGASFNEPITMNIYAVNPDNSVGALIASETKTFQIPYRPSKNDQYCTGANAGAFLGPVDKECDNGLSVKISYNFTLPKVILPASAIVTVAYNTSTAGYNPIGTGTACYTSSGGCGYDSLNVSADGTGGFIGSNVDPNGVYDNYGNSYFYCNQTSSGFILDTPCWTQYHPEIQVIAKK